MQMILVHSCAGTSVSHFDTKEATKTFWPLSHRSRGAGGVTPTLGGAGVPGAGGLRLVWVSTAAVPACGGSMLCQSCAARALLVLLCGYRCGGPSWERGREDLSLLGGFTPKHSPW